MENFKFNNSSIIIIKLRQKYLKQFLLLCRCEIFSQVKENQRKKNLLFVIIKLIKYI